MTNAPTLADVAAHPELVNDLPPSLCAKLAPEAAAVLERLRMRAAMREVAAPESLVEATDIKGASRILALSPSTLRRKIRHDRDPAYCGLLVRTGTARLVFSVRACRRFIQRRTIGRE